MRGNESDSMWEDTSSAVDRLSYLIPHNIASLLASVAIMRCLGQEGRHTGGRQRRCPPHGTAAADLEGILFQDDVSSALNSEENSVHTHQSPSLPLFQSLPLSLSPSLFQYNRSYFPAPSYTCYVCSNCQYTNHLRLLCLALPGVDEKKKLSCEKCTTHSTCLDSLTNRVEHFIKRRTVRIWQLIVIILKSPSVNIKHTNQTNTHDLNNNPFESWIRHCMACHSSMRCSSFLLFSCPSTTPHPHPHSHPQLIWIDAVFLRASYQNFIFVFVFYLLSCHIIVRKLLRCHKLISAWTIVFLFLFFIYFLPFEIFEFLYRAFEFWSLMILLTQIRSMDVCTYDNNHSLRFNLRIWPK